jgi:hypothetical protein
MFFVAGLIHWLLGLYQSNTNLAIQNLVIDGLPLKIDGSVFKIDGYIFAGFFPCSVNSGKALQAEDTCR